MKTTQTTTLNTILKALSIWLNEPNFHEIRPYKLITLMRGDYELDEDALKYMETLIGLFAKCGYEFVEDTDKKYSLSACDITVDEALPIWFAFQEFVPDADKYTLERCVSWLEHFQKYYGVGRKPELLHIGDCTKVAMSCSICCEEENLNDLRMFLTMVCWSGVSIKKVVS